MATKADQQLHEDLFGRGPGDPDHWGYPGQEKPRAFVATTVMQKITIKNAHSREHALEILRHGGVKEDSIIDLEEKK